MLLKKYAETHIHSLLYIGIVQHDVSSVRSSREVPIGIRMQLISVAASFVRALNFFLVSNGVLGTILV